MSEQEKMELAERIKKECIKAAKEGFREASMSGLCTEGAMEAAVSAIQNLNLGKLLNTNE
ncbi:acetyltransferase [Rhodohalobacter halophilus]|uniref:acetyltransferase n=1 Tax=Rhodohalobacter halophilus TaxID=1812810 RepID=UPI00083FA3BD|nr:acetyltransferase [Rhodohalobacter halophilus]